MKRFIVALDSYTPEQDKAFKEYIVSNNLGWWHWLSNFWMLVSLDEQMTAVRIRDAMQQIYPGVHNVGIELRSDSTDTWAGVGPTGKNIFDWVRRNWKRS